MSLRLKGRRVVVKADLPSEQIGSIVIPEKYRQQPLTGEVVLVGDKVTTVRVGDRVLFPSIAWSRWHPLGFPHMLLKEEDLLACLES